MMPIKNNYDFYAVMEQTTPEQAAVKVIKEEKQDGELRFLRYRQCLQSFGHRNRNKRLWQASHLKAMLKHPWVVQQLEQKGGLPGENGHPAAESGEISMERLCKVDPNNICLLLKSYSFENNDTMLFGVVETIDDGNGPGNRLMRNILQGIVPAVSCRTLVPQRKNPDGSIDVTGPGRLICYDRVFTPSHEEAFMDTNAKVEKVTIGAPSVVTTQAPAFECAVKDLANWAYNKSDTAKFILEGMDACMESLNLDKDLNLTAKTNDGRIYIPMRHEDDIGKAIDFYMRGIR